MSVLLHISDTHFGTEQPPVVEALIGFALEHKPDLVVLSGDITQRARPKQFRAARKFVDRLKAPLLTIPGNHDIPLFDLFTRLVRPYSRYVAVFGNQLEPEHSCDDLLVLCVKTTRRWRHVNGEISKQQIERTGLRLEQASLRQLRIVVVHQPVAVPRPEDAHDRLRGFDRALARWADAGCDLVMGGHIHLPYVIELPDLKRPVWAVQAGTAVSHRVRGAVPNSVNLLRWDAQALRCVVERWDYDAAPRAFAQVAVTELLMHRDELPD